jgi:hypothetical protein
MICRCAWHPRYYGRSFWKGIASWRGWRIQFTDGICNQCAERFLAEHRSAIQRRAVAGRRLNAVA